MEDKNLELRMYFFVPYNISPIQQAIQAGHAALEYALYHGANEDFREFARNWKTWIILDGGTTNDELDIDEKPVGTLNLISEDLLKNDITFSWFREPDLNHALTAVCFICDERVFNKKEYPEFVDYILDVKMYKDAREAIPAQNVVMLKMQSMESLEEKFPEYYKEWVRFIGGMKNLFLRELLKGKKKA